MTANLPTIHCDTSGADFDLPEGDYLARFESLKDLEPFANSIFLNDDGTPKAPEPRWGWRFRVLEGPQRGKVLEQVTGRKVGHSDACKLNHVLHMLQGRPVADQQAFRVADFVGRTYRITWAANPKSKKNRCHIVAMREVQHTPDNGAAAPPPAAGNGAPPPNPPTAPRPALPRRNAPRRRRPLRARCSRSSCRSARPP
jgi:hypothetical protein